jgi:hypothetical protein
MGSMLIVLELINAMKERKPRDHTIFNGMSARISR